MIHTCPDRVKDETVISFIHQLWEHADDPKFTIDFSKLEFVLPFAALLLAESLRELVRYRDEIGLQTLSNAESELFQQDGAISYLKHVGFFQFVGMAYGKEPNEALGNRNYIPIRKLTKGELRRRAPRDVIQKAIEEESEEIAGLIFDNIQKDIMLAYCFREIIRNVFEHAEIDYCLLMGQKWNRGYYDGIVEIAIVDRGRGILDSLREAYALESAEQAIKKAIEPGTSRIQQPQDQDNWDNTGYGLYILSKLGMLYGEFVICSSGIMLKVTEEHEHLIDVQFNGTAVKLRVNTQQAEYFPNALKKIVQEGEELYYEQTGKRKEASASSKHLF